MNKQEFLSFSLPHELKATIHHLTNVIVDATWYAREFEDNAIKILPILHPLSDLTKPIKHKGEEFIPIAIFLEDIVREWNMCNINYPNDAKGLYGDIIKNITSCEFWIIQKLIEWHFDLFGGIESGEAIDVNTLDINPYE